MLLAHNDDDFLVDWADQNVLYQSVYPLGGTCNPTQDVRHFNPVFARVSAAVQPPPRRSAENCAVVRTEPLKILDRAIENDFTH